MQALIAGSVDVAISTGTAAVFAAYVKGAPIRPVATSVTGAREIFWYVKADSPIKDADGCRRQDHGVLGDRSSSNLATLKLIKMAVSTSKPVSTGVPVATFTKTMTGQVDIGGRRAVCVWARSRKSAFAPSPMSATSWNYRDMSARLHVANMNLSRQADVSSGS